MTCLPVFWVYFNRKPISGQDSGSSWNNMEMDFSTHGLNYNSSTGTWDDIKYDENGNILEMGTQGFKVGHPATSIDALTYNYNASSNQLTSVAEAANDPNSTLGDYKYAASQSQSSYSYDDNGNMVTDNAKGLSVTYNHVNLASAIQTSQGNINYSYDALGRKLVKTVTDNGISGKTITTVTNYIGVFIFENKTTTNPSSQDPANYTNKLQFISHEEGRIRPLREVSGQITGYAYDYFIKDHLGNVRVVITEEQQQDKYPIASLESSKIATEEAYYNIDNAQVVDASSISGGPTYINDNGIGNNPSDAGFEQTTSQKVYKLNSSSAKTGLGITLKVMAGDRIDIWGRSFYTNTNTGGNSANSSIPIADIISGLLGGASGVVGATTHMSISSPMLASQSGTTSGINSLFSNETTDNNQKTQIPKAYVNYLLFDEHFNCVGGNFSPAGNTQHHNDSRMQDIEIPKNGYIYVYCSNESPVNVYFDNLQVVHTRGALLEEIHYYPFGLAMQGISSKALAFGAPNNKYKYNDKEEQRQEFQDGSGLDWLDYGARMYDAQLGRWHVMDPHTENYSNQSPYSYVMNMPIIAVDPNGMDTHLSGEAAQQFFGQLQQSSGSGIDKIDAMAQSIMQLNGGENETNFTIDPKDFKSFEVKDAKGQKIGVLYSYMRVVARQQEEEEQYRTKGIHVLFGFISSNSNIKTTDLNWIQRVKTNNPLGNQKANEWFNDGNAHPYYTSNERVRAEIAAEKPQDPNGAGYYTTWLNDLIDRFYMTSSGRYINTQWTANLSLVNVNNHNSSLITILYGFVIQNGKVTPIERIQIPKSH